MSIGARLKKWRKDKGLTLKQISIDTSLSHGGLSANERDEKTISVTSLVKLSKIYEIDIGYIITGESNKDPTSIDKEIYELISDLTETEKAMLLGIMIDKKQLILERRK